MGKMSAKRRPGTDLNHDNWDDDQEQEEVGEFRKASADELKQRTFKVAKRRMRTAGGGGGDDDADGGSGAAPAAASAFSGFGGFGKLGDGKPASSPFSFLSSSAASTVPAAASSSVATVSPFATLSSSLSGGGGGSASTSSGSNGTLTTTSNSTASSSTTAANAPKDANYYAKLKGLNQSVSAWIAKHIADNPVCVLTPIFDDYARHLKEIQQSQSAASATDATSATRQTVTIKTPDYTFKSAASSASSAKKETDAAPASTFSFGIAADKKPTEAAAATSNFSFGSAAPGKTTEPAKSTFSFGSALSKPPVSDEAAVAKPSTSTFSFGSIGTSAASSGGASGFSFGGAASTPFTFANIKTPADHAAERAAGGGPSTEAEDENEEPPKNEFTPVVEDDSLHTQRCKVFVKSGADYVDRGVGQLFIKSAAEGTKTQLLVRADTNLGNIVLNILLTDAVPVSRMGKNNVMMICVPTPDSKPPPVTVLVRVKNAEEADELLAQINKHKK